MGSLIRFPLSDDFVSHFPVFIETGYGNGRSLRYAASHKFIKLYSIEIWPEAAEAGRKEFFTDVRVDVLNGNSPVVLNTLLETTNYPILFWLDAHFPGNSYDLEKDLSIRFPLIEELEIIKRLRPDNNYFILIDDLRIYADYDWGDGPCLGEEGKSLPKNRNLDFLLPFHETHCVSIDLHDSGYALIGPHTSPWLEFTESG